MSKETTRANALKIWYKNYRIMTFSKLFQHVSFILRKQYFPEHVLAGILFILLIVLIAEICYSQRCL